MPLSDLRLYEYYTSGKSGIHCCAILGTFTSLTEASEEGRKRHDVLSASNVEAHRHVGVAVRADNGGVLFQVPDDFLSTFY